MTGWLIGIIVVYILSVLWCRYETKVYHGDTLELTMEDVVMTLVPILNLFVAFDSAIVNGRWRNNISKKVARKYFGK